MKTHHNRGSVVLITLVFVIILTASAISVLELSMNSYRLAMRNQMRAEARAVAESELEYVYFQFKSTVLAGNSASAAPGLVAGVDNAVLPTTLQPHAFFVDHQTAGWNVRRSLVLDRAPITGTIPGTTKVGTYTYIVARVEVIPPTASAFAGVSTVRVGRRFINSNTPIFQYSIFFQGDLELNPGTDTIINGDVIANGSIYMGPAIGKALTLNNNVSYLYGHYFNVDSGGAAVYSNPNAPTPPVTLVAPTWGTSQASQLKTLAEPENLLGGIDVTATAKGRPDLFGPAGSANSQAPTLWTSAEQAAAENNVLRSLIVPPPANSTTNEYPYATTGTADDSVISVRRAYSRASLLLTVDSAGTVQFDKVDAGVTTTVTSQFPGVVLATSLIYDAREAKNVKVTRIDVGVLKTKLDGLLAAVDTTHFDFNGLLYVNLLSSTSAAPSAIRLENATVVPSCGASGQEKGFSVATNGGLYVKGSYNTSPLITATDGTSRNLPAMLIADAVTVLSTSWNDANAGAALTSRVATSGVTNINAGLLTGNMTSAPGASSGGAQNLVRYLEDWTGATVTYLGSLGRLFTSTQFISAYPGPGTIYKQPNRNFTFDSYMLQPPSPPGTPTTTAFSRGSFFTW